MTESAERRVRINEPITVFVIGKKEYSVRELPINKADEWYVRVDDVMRAEQAIKSASNGDDIEALIMARRQFRQAIADCVFGYDPVALPREELESTISPAQMVDAFYLLRERTDPFEVSQMVYLKEIRPILDMLAQVEQTQKPLSDTPKPAS